MINRFPLYFYILRVFFFSFFHSVYITIAFALFDDPAVCYGLLYNYKPRDVTTSHKYILQVTTLLTARLSIRFYNAESREIDIRDRFSVFYNTDNIYTDLARTYISLGFPSER